MIFSEQVFPVLSDKALILMTKEEAESSTAEACKQGHRIFRVDGGYFPTTINSAHFYAFER